MLQSTSTIRTTNEYTWRTHLKHILDHNGSLAYELWKLSYRESLWRMNLLINSQKRGYFYQITTLGGLFLRKITTPNSLEIMTHVIHIMKVLVVTLYH